MGKKLVMNNEIDEYCAMMKRIGMNITRRAVIVWLNLMKEVTE